MFHFHELQVVELKVDANSSTSETRLVTKDVSVISTAFTFILSDDKICFGWFLGQTLIIS